jgi:UV DNA damage endonuclease
MRISMHPNQFVILTLKMRVIENSIRAQYHSDLLESIDIPFDAKIQIHIGGIYDNKSFAKERFIKIFTNLDENLKNRIVIENDDRLYALKDCVELNKQTDPNYIRYISWLCSLKHFQLIIMIINKKV